METAGPGYLDQALYLRRTDPGGGRLRGPRVGLAGGRPPGRRRVSIRLEGLLVAQEPPVVESPEPDSRILPLRRPRAPLHRYFDQSARRMDLDRDPGHQSGRPPYRGDGQPARSPAPRNATGSAGNDAGRRTALRPDRGRDGGAEPGPGRTVDHRVRGQPSAVRASGVRRAGGTSGLGTRRRPFRRRGLRQPVRRRIDPVLPGGRRDRSPWAGPVHPGLHAPGGSLPDEDMGGHRRAGRFSVRTRRFRGGHRLRTSASGSGTGPVAAPGRASRAVGRSLHRQVLAAGREGRGGTRSGPRPDTPIRDHRQRGHAAVRIARTVLRRHHPVPDFRLLRTGILPDRAVRLTADYHGGARAVRGHGGDSLRQDRLPRGGEDARSTRRTQPLLQHHGAEH